MPASELDRSFLLGPPLLNVILGRYELYESTGQYWVNCMGFALHIFIVLMNIVAF